MRLIIAVLGLEKNTQVEPSGQALRHSYIIGFAEQKDSSPFSPLLREGGEDAFCVEPDEGVHPLTRRSLRSRPPSPTVGRGLIP
jgi:hypothetical protein